MRYRKKRISIPEPRKGVGVRYTYEELYEEYWPIFHSRYNSALGDHWLAEDLAQEAMARVFRYWNRIQWDKLTGALGVIVNHVRYDYLRANFNRVDRDFYEDRLEFDHHDEGITDPLRMLIISRGMTAVDDFVPVLKESDRELFLDYYTRDIQIDELCERHNKTSNNIYVCLHRIRKVFFECYSAYDLIPDERWFNGLEN